MRIRERDSSDPGSATLLQYLTHWSIPLIGRFKHIGNGLEPGGAGLWACLGHRYGEDGDPGAGAGGARRHQGLASRARQSSGTKSTDHQGCGSAFISSGSGSSILGWIPIRIRILSGSRALMTKKWKKLKLKKNYIFFWSKTAFYLSLGLRKVRPRYKRSLQLSKEAIQYLKTWTLKSFSTFVGHFCPPGSGSGFRSGSADPIESWSIPDPDPQPCCPPPLPCLLAAYMLQPCRTKPVAEGSG